MRGILGLHDDIMVADAGEFWTIFKGFFFN